MNPNRLTRDDLQEQLRRANVNLQAAQAEIEALRTAAPALTDRERFMAERLRYHSGSDELTLEWYVVEAEQEARDWRLQYDSLDVETRRVRADRNQALHDRDLAEIEASKLRETIKTVRAELATATAAAEHNAAIGAILLDVLAHTDLGRHVISGLIAKLVTV